MKTSHSDSSAHSERALLGLIYFRMIFWPHTEGLSAEDFGLDSHRVIFALMATMFEAHRPADLVHHSPS